MLIMSIQDFSMYAKVWLKIKQRISYLMIGILSDWALLASYCLNQVCMNHMNVMIKISPISAIVIISNILCRMVSQIFYISWDIEPHSKKKQNITVAKKNHSSVKSAFHVSCPKWSHNCSQCHTYMYCSCFGVYNVKI